MFRRFVALLMLVVAGCESGLLTAADEDDMDPVIAAVGRDRSTNIQLRHWMMLDQMERSTSNRPVGRVTCDDPTRNREVTARAVANHFRDFLNSGPRTEFVASEFMSWIRQRYIDAGCRIEFDGYPSFWPHDDTEMLPSDDDPGGISNRDIANWLIALTALELTRMPSVMSLLGLSVGTSGAIFALDGIGLVLCPLSTSIGCPDDPGAPGTPQPGTPQPDGDR